MLIYIARRVLQTIPVMIGVTFFVFLLLYLVPGDPARILAGETADPASVELLREQLGLNDPFYVQYFRFLRRISQGDMGYSNRSNRPVVNEIFEARFGTTMQLAVSATIVTTLLGLLVGIIQATRKYSYMDTFLMILSFIFISIPNFFLGILLIRFFGVQLRLLPIIGWGTWQQMVMPVMMLALTGSAVVARMTRANLIEVMNQDYVRTAYSKGLSQRIVVYKHALRNALIPVITIVGLQFGGLLAGAAITETIFAINGMGRFMIEAIQLRDFPVVQGALLVTASLFVLVNLLVDVTYRLINKRIDYS